MMPISEKRDRIQNREDERGTGFTGAMMPTSGKRDRIHSSDDANLWEKRQDSQ